MGMDGDISTRWTLVTVHCKEYTVKLVILAAEMPLLFYIEQYNPGAPCALAYIGRSGYGFMVIL